MWMRIIIAVCTMIAVSKSEEYQTLYNLTNSLLVGYTRSIIPVKNQSTKIKLDMDISLKAINKFNVVDGHLTIVTAIALKWRDELLSWKPELWNNVTDVNFPLSKIWAPNMYLLNCAEEFVLNKGEPETKEVTYHSNGEVLLFFMEVLTTTCTSNIAYYPNDLHKCNIYLSTLTAAQKLRMGLAKVNTVDFEENGEWNLAGTESRVEYLPTPKIERVVITLSLERKMMFHMINVVIPVVFLGLVNVIVFKLPVDSGERMSFAMTVLLSFAVFMTLIADKMPQTSNTTSVFSLYLVAMLNYSTLITFATTFSIKKHHSDSNEAMTDKEQTQKTWMSGQKVTRQNTNSVQSIKKKQNLNESLRKEYNAACDELKRVQETPSEFFDRLFFVFFLLYFTIATVLFFCAVLSRFP